MALPGLAVTGFVPPPGDKTGSCILAIIQLYLGDGEGNHQGDVQGGLMGMNKSCSPL